MKETTVLPIWLVVVLTVVPAIIAGGSAVLSAWLGGARKTARELDRWRRREETMRLLRWSADKVVAVQESERDLGVKMLEALTESKPALLQAEDQAIVMAALACLTGPPEAAVEAYAEETGTYEAEVTPQDG